MAKGKEEPKVEESKREIVEVKESNQSISTMQLKDMKKLLKQEKEKRSYLLGFIRDNLTPGIDYAMIHRKKKIENKAWVDCKYKDQIVLRDKKGELIYQCPDCGAKYSLWKPGAESICGFLKVRPHFEVDFDAMEVLGLVGNGIIYKCTLIEEWSGKIVSEGGGGRTLSQDNDDINKCIKMSRKSSHIDATCRLKGLSKMFTQDIEDMIGDVGDIFEITWKTKAGYDEIRKYIKDPRIKANLKETLIKGINEDSEENKMIEWLIGLQPEFRALAEKIPAQFTQDTGEAEVEEIEESEPESTKSITKAQQELFDKLIQSHVFPDFEIKELNKDFPGQPSLVLEFMRLEIARRKMIEQMLDAGKLKGKTLKTLSAMEQKQIEQIATKLKGIEGKKEKKSKLEEMLVEKE